MFSGDGVQWLAMDIYSGDDAGGRMRGVFLQVGIHVEAQKAHACFHDYGMGLYGGMGGLL